MFLAADSSAGFDFWDFFMIAYTIIIAIGFLRLLKSPERNKFALAFTAVALLSFLFVDLMMVFNWFGFLDEVSDLMPW